MLPYIIGIGLCLVLLGIRAAYVLVQRAVQRAVQRRREAREAALFAKLESDAQAKRAPLPKGEKSMLDVLREDPSYVPPKEAGTEAAAEAHPVGAAGEAAPAAEAAPVAAGSPGPHPLLKLGSWPQGPNGEREPIEWIALKQEPERTLALSRYILDLQPFHSEAAPTRWEHPDLRKWLANDFFNDAFTPEEQARICQPEPAENPAGDMLWQLFSMETVTGSIDDRVFVLNAADLSEFFPGENAMFHPGCTAEPTPWVEAQGEGDPGEHSWWLRSSMQNMAMAYIASPANSMGVSAIGSDNRNGVRPAVWLRKDAGGAV